MRVAAVIVWMLAACSAEGTGRSSRSDAGTSDASRRDDAGAGSTEACDRLDDDADGRVDEGCSCATGATQECFPAPSMAASCRTGTQTCVDVESGGAWSECTGALVPLEGQTECCTALGPMPEHAALDGFLAAYPFATIPSHHTMMAAFLPDTGMYRMTTARVVSGDEIIDPSRGGVTVDNLRAGREATRMAALADLTIDPAAILDTREPEPEISAGDASCMRWGAAWGSFLYRTAAGGLEEVVYLYVGICNDGDAEGYYRSETPLEVCEEGTVPLI
jgi:hypothetical protein